MGIQVSREFKRFIDEDYGPSWSEIVKTWCSDFSSRCDLEVKVFGAPLECEPGDQRRIDELNRFWGLLLAPLPPDERYALEVESGLCAGYIPEEHELYDITRQRWFKELAGQGDLKTLQAHVAQLVVDAVMRTR